MNKITYQTINKSYLIKRILCCVMILILSFSSVLTAMAAPPEVETPSYIVMEAMTGQVVCENNATVKLSPASITKVMTLLIIFDYMEKGRIKLENEVITSAYAKSMGGSQVFLEEGEIQTLDTLIKCIAVASGNDASVAAAEYIAGSEEEFVQLMNDRAKDLGMKDTHFEDCSGLSDSDDHHTSAKDVAIMSRELITKYPQVLHYTGIWMEDITHTTARGSSTFTLSSTNKLLKMYEWTTGLKTGSTSKAKYCLSATASREGVDMICVVMAAPNNKVRFQDAMTLLNYGYGVSAMYEDKNEDLLVPLPVKGGIAEEAAICYEGPFHYLDIKGSDFTQIEKVINLPEQLIAPIQRGDPIGEAVYRLNGERIGSVSIFADVTVEKAGYTDYVTKAFRMLLV